MSIIREVEIEGKKYTFEFNKFAKQTSGSVMVSCEDTQVLVALCCSKNPKEGQSFFPLTVDYIEKGYAAGRIPGGFGKRETRPGPSELLTARVIDRSLRPLFPDGFLNETNITATVMSYDGINDPVPLALIGASCCLSISDVPFNGPVAMQRVGMQDGQLKVAIPKGEPTDLDLLITAKPGAVVMVEAGANFVSEDKMIEAINFGFEKMKPFFEMIQSIQSEIGKPKRKTEIPETDAALKQKCADFCSSKLPEAMTIPTKMERYDALDQLKVELVDHIMAQFNEGDEIPATIKDDISDCYSELKSEFVRKRLSTENLRIDGRSPTDIRDISCEVGILKRPHGSALFTRGETQAIATVTLGSGGDELYSDTIREKQGTTSKFMMHYNFPPFSVGEARPLRAPSRREIGHGALAERAVTPALPDEADFGYTIRVVSEVLESNGSSSMATVCGATMSMLAASVPLKDHIAGIAMGLVKEGDKHIVLSDILGDEDHLGDMDFKVCGSRKGITALQMDIKIDGLGADVMAKALDQAKAGRIHILDKMEEAISKPAELSKHAPQIFYLKVADDRVRDVIGPGGKNIKRVISETNSKIDIDDTGLINIISPDSTSAEAAKAMIRTIIANPEMGGIYLGQVTRVVDFGAFVEIKPGTEGLLHISQIAEERINSVDDVLSLGQEVVVKVIDIDRQGRIKLSRKDALGQKPTYEKLF